MNNNNFDHLIPEISKILTNAFTERLSIVTEFRGDVDTAPLLNMTLGAYMSSLLYILDIIRHATQGEEKLLENIELARSSLLKTIEDLPFISKVEFF